MYRGSLKCREGKAGFTIIEMLASLTVLLIILVVVFSVLQQVTKVWHSSVGKVENVRDARNAFASMTHTISQATLNTYWDYLNSSNQSLSQFYTATPGGTFTPKTYGRISDLHFISGNTSNTNLSTLSTVMPKPITHSIFFLAPLGATNTSSYQVLNGLLNACGFYVCYGPDPTVPNFLSGTIVPAHYRYRLMQFTQPSEYLSVYDAQTQGSTPLAYSQWYLGPLATDLAKSSPITVSQIAQNVVALVILPKNSAADDPTGTAIAPAYDYDSRNAGTAATYNQLPPVVEVTMVVLDEGSALKLGNSVTPPNLSQGAPFTDATKMGADLTTLENNLSAVSGNSAGNKIPLNYQVFQSDVAIQGAKWSQ